jgi:hypothetical protein
MNIPEYRRRGGKWWHLDSGDAWPLSHWTNVPSDDNSEIVERNGRPVAFYTDKASLFQTTPKLRRIDKEQELQERQPLPPTQIGRALRELGITWIAAHSPREKA